MPNNWDKSSPSVPPKLVISKPADDLSPSSPQDSTLATRRASAGPRPAHKEHTRTSSSEWIDIDDKPKRRRKRRTSRVSDKPGSRPSSSPSGSQVSQRSEASDIGRFIPKLSRIFESQEGASSPRGSDVSRRRREHTSAQRRRYPEDANSIYRRPARHRTGGAARRADGLRINPSLLSVLSSMTGNSDKSSGSNSTITQGSYDRHSSRSPTASRARPFLKRNDTEVSLTPSGWSGSKAPNVFDYIQAPSTVNDDANDDGQSAFSASSVSSYQPSEAGSSEAPETPSSHSTFPSPTATRRASVAELRKRYDTSSMASGSSVRSSSRSPGMSNRKLRQPSVGVVNEDDDQSILTGYDDESSVAPTAASEMSYASDGRSAYTTRSEDYRRWQQEDQRRHQMAQVHQSHQHGHEVDPTYGQRRSASASSQTSEYQAWAQHMALQQYQHPSSPVLFAQHNLHESMNGQIEQPVNRRPSAPTPPDLTQRTIIGYEKLALELADTDSAVTPVYRKFEYLNHRILLHLQDELCELEEQLRTVDEIIAQLTPPATGHHDFTESTPVPSSRRGEAFHGAEIHHQRTALLGRIFLKTEQYNRAMSSYNGLCKHGHAAEDGQVAPYKEWIEKHQPVHEVETRFLHSGGDLILPGKQAKKPHEAGPASWRSSSPSSTSEEQEETEVEGPAAQAPQAGVSITPLLIACLVFIIGLLSGALLRS